MIDLVEQHRTDIAALCERYGVCRLDLFGSAARGDDFSEASDIDFVVTYDDARQPPSLRDYFGLKEDLELALGRSVDLLMSGAIRNPHLARSIDEDRVLVHEARA